MFRISSSRLTLKRKKKTNHSLISAIKDDERSR